MGNSPMYPSPDDRQHFGSGAWPNRREEAEPWGVPQHPGYGKDSQWNPTHTQYYRQAPESSGSSGRIEPRNDPDRNPGYVRNGQDPGVGGDEYRASAERPTRLRQQEAWIYREPNPPDRVSRSRMLSGAAPQQSSAVGPEESQQSGNRPRPGTANASMPAGGRFSFGWVSALTVSTLLGLVLVRIADADASSGGNVISAVELFFFGLIVIFAPYAMRILMRKTANIERFTLVIMLGVTFYVVKVLAGPTAFIYNDEFIHLRNAQNIISSGHLFQFNPILPTAGYYPGLAAVTATLVSLTGLSTFICGTLIMGVGRVVISASLYFIAERVTGSSRGAGVASLLYATNSMFLFWSAQFAYEDLALPLAAFVVWWLTRTRGIRGGAAAQVITVIGIAAVTVSHHVTAFALCAILAALYLAECIFGYPSATRRYLGAFAALTGAAAAFWLFVVAKPAADYLFGENVGPATQGLLSAITGRGDQRQLYGGGGSASPPAWYVYIGFVAILVIMVALLPAAIRALRILRTHSFSSTIRRRASVAVAAVIAISFPLTLLPRLTSTGTAISARTSELIFTGIGCTVGLLWGEFEHPTKSGTQRVPRMARLGGLWTLLATSLLSLVLVGQVSVGTSFFTILPATTVGFPVYVQPYMISAAEWSRQHLGPNQTFATDNNNTLTLAGYGEEDPEDVDYIWPIFYSANMDSVTIDTIKKYDIHYVLLDWIATTEAPIKPGGDYYSSLEPINSLHGGALPKSYYSKFSAYTCSRKVYQAGTVQIYDVSRIAKGICAPQRMTNGPSKTSSGKKASSLKRAS
jgi:hypothetical protein